MGPKRVFDKIDTDEELQAITRRVKRLVMDRTAKLEKAKRELAASEEKLRNLFDSIVDGIGAIDLNAVYTEVNQGLLKIYGCSSPDEVLGKSFFTFVAPRDIEGIMVEMQKTIEADSITRVEYTGLRADGSEFHAEAIRAMVKDSSGNAAGFIGVIRDITERKRAEEALRASEERYRQLVSGLQDAYTILQEGKIVFANEKLAEMSGYDLRELISVDIVRLWPPHLRKRAEELFEQVRRGETLPERIEGRILNKNGIIVPVEVTHKSFDYEGKPSISLLLRDITERKWMEKTLRESAEKLRSMFESATEGITVTDLSGVVVEINQRILEMHGFSSKDEVLGKSAFEFIAHYDHNGAMENMMITLEHGSVRGVEYSLIRADGSEFPGELSASVLKDASGNPVGFIAITRDITERKKAEEELRESERRIRELSITDELTGLHNHRHFYEVLDTEMNRTERYSHSFSLVVLDLDGFKKYNDNFGHTNGDAILRSFAQTLKSTLRKSDTAFRYGGDEFTIILPATDVDKATRVVDRIRSKWSQVGKAQNIFLETPPGFSAGIAEFPGNAETADGLVFLADAALYRSKRQGGHKTTVVSDLGALTRDVMDTQTLDQIYALSATVEAKDPYTYGHSKGVAAISEMIGKALGLSREELANLHAAGLLHDIGKVGVSDTILTKPSKPTEDEWEVLRKHSAEGARIVGNVKELAPLVPMIRHHHEWYDGTGYPGGLKGEDIPIGARIIGIADAYDTMTTHRTYRDVVSQAEALEELRRCSGTQFDAELVEVICRAVHQSNRQDEAQLSK